MSDMVVTLSGVISLAEIEGKTADQLINLALANWNIHKDSIEAPFITIHNRNSNRQNPVQGQEVIANLRDDDVVRVILPLKTKHVESDTKQYLVEG